MRLHYMTSSMTDDVEDINNSQKAMTITLKLVFIK